MLLFSRGKKIFIKLNKASLVETTWNLADISIQKKDICCIFTHLSKRFS